MAFQLPFKHHDEFFRETFTQLPLARAFFKSFLPEWLAERLDFEHLQIENSAFTDEALGEHYADVVFTCPYRGSKKVVELTLLMEHKAGAVGFPTPQILRYIGLRLEAQRKEKQPLTLVVPILFVQGPRAFKLKPIEHYFEGLDEELRRFLPRQEIIVINLTQEPDEKILAVDDNLLKVGLFVMKHIWREQKIVESAREVFGHLKKVANYEQMRGYMRSLLLYLFTNSKTTPAERQSVVQNIPDNLKNTAMNTLEMIFQEGIEKGIEKGIEEGIEKGIEKGEIVGQKKSIRQLLLHGYQPEQVVDLLAVPLALVNEVVQEMKAEKP